MTGNTNGAQKAKEKYGEDVFRKAGAQGGKHKGQGYFGWLKKNDPEKFATLQAQATAKAAERNRKKKSDAI